MESSREFHIAFGCRRASRCLTCGTIERPHAVCRLHLSTMRIELTCSRKVGHVLFNPAASNVLASSSGDYTIKLWDIEQGQSRLTLKGTDIFQSMSWSADGAFLVTTSRDKKLRVWDVRQEKPVQEVPVSRHQLRS